MHNCLSAAVAAGGVFSMEEQPTHFRHSHSCRKCRQSLLGALITSFADNIHTYMYGAQSQLHPTTPVLIATRISCPASGKIINNNHFMPRRKNLRQQQNLVTSIRVYGAIFNYHFRIRISVLSGSKATHSLVSIHLWLYGAQGPLSLICFHFHFHFHGRCVPVPFDIRTKKASQTIHRMLSF